jgi:hypothetical protein
MKPSERIKDIADGYFVKYPEAIMFFLDEQAELLETHTVKEEECDCNGMHEGNCPDPRFERKEEPIEHECHKEECCENLCHCDDDAIGHFIGVEGCHKEGVKEEPTTTEKKCCDESCDDCRKDGFHSLDCPTTRT